MSKPLTATLIAHSGAVKVNRGELFSIPAPPRTITHRTFAHKDLIGYMETRLASHGLSIRNEEFAVQNDGLRLFGLLKLAYQTSDNYSFAVAFRTSNDKTIPLTAIAGVNVFVCDNMALSGDAEILHKKHTGNLDIRGEVFLAIDRAVNRFAGLGRNISRLTETSISDDRAKALILDAATSGIISGKSDIGGVVKEYFEPRYAEFEPRTLWSLHNAFTEVFKGFRYNVALEANQELGKLFQI
jgi:hypothetical protein